MGQTGFPFLPSGGGLRHPGEGAALISRGEWKEAEQGLAWLIEAARADGCTGRLIELLLLEALALQAQGQSAAALRALEECLDLAEPEGYLRIFLDEGEPMTGLLEAALHGGIHPDYAAQLLESFPGAAPRETPAARPSRQAQALREPLTEREIEVLRLVAAGLTNKEIALRLCISVRTVKYHTTSIFTKLDASEPRPGCPPGKRIGGSLNRSGVGEKNAKMRRLRAAARKRLILALFVPNLYLCTVSTVPRSRYTLL